MRIARLLLLALLPGTLAAQPLPDLPATRRVDQVDNYHGQAVADPYRWLEDDNAPETAAWVAAQNRVTEAYFQRLPYRQALRQRLTQLQDHARRTVPERRGEWLYYRSNTGLQNQNVIVRQLGLDGMPQIVLDPNLLSPDGTTRVTQFVLQASGRHAAYTQSRAGSDWLEIRVLDLETLKPLPDRIEWVKVSGIAWAGDGFFYSRYPAPAAGQELSSRNENHQVFFHRVGRPAAEDEPVFADPAHGQRFHTVSTSDNGRWAVLSVSDRGTGKRGNALFVRDLSAPGSRFVPIVPEVGDATTSFIDEIGGQLLLRSNRDAPNGRLLLVDPKAPDQAHWRTLLAERTEPLRDVSVAGGRIFVSTLKDVTSRVEVLRANGTLERRVELPGLGSTEGFLGRADDGQVFYGYTSFDTPPSIYRYDIASGRSTPFFAPTLPGFDAAAYETAQVFYPSRDGTRVPMFLVHRKGLRRDGTNPVLLYGYGGFNISLTPSFDPLRLALLEQGVVFAVANLRGGGEYGEAWHQAGTKLKKQNVFDDFIAAAEWLIQEKITVPAKLAVQGGSNGGLLVGAVINQRPELFAAAVPQVGVMDMLRFHKFTIGWNWIADYGSSDKPDEFKALYAYSPLHNIREGTRYPATLITTADHDDRVVPAHSFKYAATLQAKAAPGRPVLIRIETQSGHGASSTAKRIDVAADVDAFLFRELGVAPKFGL